VRVEITEQTIWIWLALVMIAVSILALFGWVARTQHYAPDDPLSKNDTEELEKVAANALDKAQQAAITLEYAQTALALAEAEREQAWHEHTSANTALEKANAELEAMPVEVMSSHEQRDVSKAARDAFRRGMISEQQLRAVWHKVDGWDHMLQERTAELSRLRAEVAEAWRRYHIASAAERMARQRADIAQVAARALKEEATDAAREAELAKQKRR
jgi:hypothetical protein